MAAADQYRAIMTNTVTGAGNPAIVDFWTQLNFGGAPAPGVVAGITAYIGALGVAGVFGASTVLFGIDYVAAGAHGALPCAFPTTEYGLYLADNAGVIPAWTAFGTGTGSGALEAIGIAVTCSLYTGIPGRSTTGRHYLPYIGEALNDGNGRLVSTAPAQIQAAYNAFLLGQTNATYDGSSVIHLAPCVHSDKLGTATDIVLPKVSRNFARLKTRTR